MRGIYIRCPICRKHIAKYNMNGTVKKLKNCTKCNSKLPDTNKDYYIRYKNKWEKIGNSLENAKIRLNKLKSLNDEEYLGIMSQRRSNLKFKDFVENYYEPHLKEESEKRNTSTYKYEKSRLNILKNHFNNSFLKDIKTNDILEFLRNRRNLNVQESTIDHFITRLKAIFKYALEQNIITNNVMQNIKVTNMTNEIERILNKNEINQLSESSKLSRNKELYYIILTAMNTCLRKSGILALKVKYFDFDKKVLKLPPKFNKNNQVLRIAIATKYSEAIQKYIKENKLRKNDLLFKSKNFDGAWKNALKRAEIYNFRFHDLRHTGATIMLALNIEIEIVRQILGHKDIRTTMRYIHYTNTASREAIEKMNEYIS